MAVLRGLTNSCGKKRCEKKGEKGEKEKKKKGKGEKERYRMQCTKE